MGLKDAMKQAKEAQQMAQDMAQQGTPGMGDVDMDEAAAEGQRLAKISSSGVDKLAEVRSLQATGRKNVGGNDEYAIDVQVQPDEGASGDGYSVTFKQYLIPDQLPGLSDGTTIKVKIDPDDPDSMIYWGAP